MKNSIQLDYGYERYLTLYIKESIFHMKLNPAKMKDKIVAIASNNIP